MAILVFKIPAGGSKTIAIPRLIINKQGHCLEIRDDISELKFFHMFPINLEISVPLNLRNYIIFLADNQAYGLLKFFFLN